MNVRAMGAVALAIAMTLTPASPSFAAEEGLSIPGLPRLELRLQGLEEALQLTPAQKDQYEVAVASTKRLLVSLALAGLQVKQRVAEELAKPRPDFGVLDDARRSIMEDTRALRREARDEWRKLYAMLDADQVATLRRFLQEQLDQVGLLNDLMLQLMLGR